MVIITLEHKEQGFMSMDIVDCEHRAFLTMKEAKKWLKDNNFYYGQRSFFQYTPSDGKEWCHKNDASWEYISVKVETIEDQNAPSRYRDFDAGVVSPWAKAALEGGSRKTVVRVLRNADIPREQIVKVFMEDFGDSKEDAEYWISACEEESDESNISEE